MDTSNTWGNMAGVYDTQERIGIANIIVQAVCSQIEKTIEVPI